jgi:hypothetical protein
MAETPTWECLHKRWHGICHTLNDDDDTSCGACGEDRPAPRPPASVAPEGAAPTPTCDRLRLTPLRERYATDPIVLGIIEAVVQLRERVRELEAPAVPTSSPPAPTPRCPVCGTIATSGVFCSDDFHVTAHEWPCEHAPGGAERCEEANCPASQTSPPASSGGAPPPRCGATNRDGYDCELPAHHDGEHRSLIGASDEQGTVPEVRWHETPIHHEFSMPSAKPAAPSPVPASPVRDEVERMREALAIADEWFGCRDCITTEYGTDERKKRYWALRRAPSPGGTSGE